MLKPRTESSSTEEPHSRLVLASASPRRRELLEAAGYRITVLPACDVTESTAAYLSARELVLLNSRRKADAAWRAGGVSEKSVVLSADTLVCLDGMVLGKPRDLDEAFEMLSRLSGRTHQVFTGVCIIGPKGKTAHFAECSGVTFRALGPGAIRGYLSRINALDKAGAYAAQEHREEIIARLEGSESNVVGLPMERVAAALAAFLIGPVASEGTAI